jgi:hypothetical protein
MLAPSERSFQMPLQQLFTLAVAAMVGLAILRVARVHLGRTPLPEGRGRRLFQLGFLIAPPIALGALVQSTTGWSPAYEAMFVPFYGLILGGLAILMGLLAVAVRRVAPARSRRVLLLALIGSEGEHDDIALDPPVTMKLAESMAVVDRTNAVFPRGPEFPAQVDRADFDSAWEALDVATTTLERRIADDLRLGLGVACAATTTAADARGRLDTLRSISLSRGLAAAV